MSIFGLSFHVGSVIALDKREWRVTAIRPNGRICLKYIGDIHDKIAG